MKISEVVTHRVVTIGRNASIVEAARSMHEHRVAEVVLVEEKGSERVPVGLLTHRDLIALIARGSGSLAELRAGEIAPKELAVADSDEDVEEVARRMLALGIRRVPVVNALGALIGIATYEELVAWMADELADFARLGEK